MSAYDNILVVIDQNREEQPALSRAITIARRIEFQQSKLTLFVSTYDFSYEMTLLSPEERQIMRDSVIKSRHQWLLELVKNYNTEGISLDYKVVWHNRPFEAIISEVFEGKQQLLIKASSTTKHLFTPTDWHLLRKCPCPVLLVKDMNWPSYRNVVGAVNFSADDEINDDLNNRITAETLRIAEALASQAHLVNAYPATPVNVTIELPEFDSLKYSDSVRGHHLLSMKTLRQHYNISEEQTHVIEGLPEDVIPQVINDLNAELIILGTSGRTGISAVFIGNTAEQLIDQIECDLLALKPKGYVSPLDPNRNKNEPVLD